MKRIMIAITVFLLCAGLAPNSFSQQRKKQGQLSSRKSLPQKETKAHEPKANDSEQKQDKALLVFNKPVTYPEMNSDEKFKLWKEQKIIILPFSDNESAYPSSRPNYSEFYRYQASDGFTFSNLVSENEFYDLYSKRPLPANGYIGKTGIIIDARYRKYRAANGIDRAEYEFLIKLDDLDEKIVALGRRNIGFFAEMDVAKNYIGQFVWSRGVYSVFPAKNTQRMMISRVEWRRWRGNSPIVLCFKSDEGKESCAEAERGTFPTGYFDNRFTTWFRPYFDDKFFYFEDPRKPYPKWKKEVWQAIENGTIELGMTLEMAKLACPDGLKISEVIISSNDPKGIGGILSGCGGKRLMIGGKIIKLVD